MPRSLLPLYVVRASVAVEAVVVSPRARVELMIGRGCDGRGRREDCRFCGTGG